MAAGTPDDLQLDRLPRRVISLVPSLTESLFDLGLGEAVVGITDFCAHPAEALAGLPRLGGPKNPRLEEILAMEPDLVLANREENTRQAVEALRSAGLRVWVTFPQTVQQAMGVLWSLARLFRSPAAAGRLGVLEKTVDWVRSEAAGRRSWRYLCPIWQGQSASGVRWWMTFNRQTYVHDLLRLVGGENPFAGRERRYPLEADLGLQEGQDPAGRDTRYPRVTLEEMRAAAPEVILLPSEPYEFGEAHCREFASLLAETSAVRHGRLHQVDGSLLTWHGTRLARALQMLPALFAGA